MTEAQVTTLAKKAHKAGIDFDVERAGTFNGVRMVWGDCRMRIRFPNFCCTGVYSDYKHTEQAILKKAHDFRHGKH
jgi:hypothetical protein